MQIKQAIQLARKGGQLMQNDSSRESNIAYQFKGDSLVRGLANVEGVLVEGKWEDTRHCRFFSVEDLLEDWTLTTIEEFTGRNRPIK